MSAEDLSLRLLSSPGYQVKPRTILAFSLSPGQAEFQSRDLLYSFTVMHQRPNLHRFQWDIDRTYAEFCQLEKDCVKNGAPAGHWLPTVKELSAAEGDCGKLQLLANYLLSLLVVPRLREVPVLLEFLEVSSQSFQHGQKSKEGYVSKRTGGRVINERRTLNFAKYFPVFQTRWMFLTSTSLCYMKNSRSQALKEAMPLQMCEISTGEGATGYEDGVCINSEKRRLVFRAGSVFKALEWVKAITAVLTAPSVLSFKSENRFASCFPERTTGTASYLIDGACYFDSVMTALEACSNEVLITDWWLSPELFLRRGPVRDQLVTVLGELADHGVRIYIIVYREIALGFYQSSGRVQDLLQARSENIKVVRHPTRDIWGGETHWSRHEKSVIIDRKVAFMGGLDLCFGRWDTPKHHLFDLHGRTWPGIDYSNPRIQDFSKVDQWQRDQLDRNANPRMPWHDVGVKLTGEVVADLVAHFVEAWDHIMTDFTGMYTRAKYMLGASEVQTEQPRLERSCTLVRPSPKRHRLNCSLAEIVEPQKEGLSEEARCQLVRSGSGWSLGSPMVDNSIQQAYLKLIKDAKHFIYIENQFFISSTAGDIVENSIGEALIARIHEAHLASKPFLVLVILPLLPAFEGTVLSSPVLKVQLFWQYQTINRSRTSIFSRLINDYGIHPEDYIRFYSLRKWSWAPDGTSCCCEQVYVHSKVMIVDDNIALIGSANINDRSLAGDRDSELAVIVEGDEKVEGMMAGKRVMVSRFARYMRLDLFEEFSGLSRDQLSDPLSADFIRCWDLVARSNQILFRELFEVAVDDGVGTYAELGEREQRGTCFHSGKLEAISGCLVPYPLHFLEQEDLGVMQLQKERLVSPKVYV